MNRRIARLVCRVVGHQPLDPNSRNVTACRRCRLVLFRDLASMLRKKPYAPPLLQRIVGGQEHFRKKYFGGV